MAEKARESLNEPWKPAPTKLNILLIDGAAVATLIAVLFFVLLPMFWMILTAFKTKGTAFRLEFVPATVLTTPEPGEDALKLATIDPDKPTLRFSYEDRNATEVIAEYKAPDMPVVTAAMTRGFDGIWSALATDIRPGDIKYRFTIAGQVKPDPTAAEGSLDDEGFATVSVKGGGLTDAGNDRVRVQRTGETVAARWRAAKNREYSLVFNDGTRLAMKEASPGVYEASAQLPPKATEWRVVEKRAFGEALGAMYTFANFKEILNSDDFDFGRFFFNSLVVAFSAGILTVLICTLAGYAFATKDFHFRDKLFTVLLASMLVPGMIFMVPQFSITIGLGWMDSYHGMVVPHLANVFGLFLLRQYISQIPKDLFAAAEIDGASEPQVFQNILIPVCLPIMVTLFLLVFVTQWSNFLWQLIINTGDSQVLTLPVGLQQFKGQNANEWEKIMAGACFSILPIAALFLGLQKYFLEGLTAGAVKE